MKTDFESDRQPPTSNANTPGGQSSAEHAPASAETRRAECSDATRPGLSSLSGRGLSSTRVEDAISEARSAAAGRSMVAAVALGALLFVLLLANVLAYRYGLFS